METSSDNNNASVIHPIKSELSVNKESENIVTLVHTVSFYRRQQSANVSFLFEFNLSIDKSSLIEISNNIYGACGTF